MAKKTYTFYCGACKKVTKLEFNWTKEEEQNYGVDSAIACKKCINTFRPLMLLKEKK